MSYSGETYGQVALGGEFVALIPEEEGFQDAAAIADCRSEFNLFPPEILRTSVFSVPAKNWNSMGAFFQKDAQATKGYAIDWRDWLLMSSDGILEDQWDVPAQLTVALQTRIESRAIIVLSGGLAGRTYELTNRITTLQGNLKAQSLFIHIFET